MSDLKAAGKTGTPVTPETFAIWQEQKRQRRAAVAAKRVEAELKKKKGGKGLSVLSGRDLYEYKRELFTKMDADVDVGGGDMIVPPRSSNNDDNNDDDDNNNTKNTAAPSVAQVAGQIESSLFLQDDDDDLDDLEDD